MKTNHFLSFLAIFAIALTFFACSSDPEPSPHPSEPSSDSSGGQMVFCKRTSGNCSQMSLSTCMDLVDAGEAQIVQNCNAEPPPPQTPSSSSVVQPPLNSSSSTPRPSSSSFASTPSNSSSSIVQGCTPADNNSTHYCSNGLLKEYGSVTDYGGRTYKTVVIGTQTWMAENLGGGVGGWGYFEDPLLDSDVCPSSWHLPNSDEWDILTNFVKTDSKCGFNCAGKKLKAKNGWNNNGNGTDDYGFSALPKGYLNLSGTSPEFEFDKGNVAVWWINSCSDALGFCDYRAIISKSDDIFDFELSPSLVASPNNVVSDGWYSVRCVKD